LLLHEAGFDQRETVFTKHGGSLLEVPDSVV